MIRAIDLRGAVSINVITMIGIGPLVTIPLVVALLHGSVALWAWIVGAAIACCDGLVYAELGSLYPSSGGTYVFLREAFGRDRFGRLMAFLFAWQYVISAPLLIATGYIGFAHYAGYFWPPLAVDARLQGIVAAGLGILTLVMLYRPIRAVGAIGIGLAGVSVATLGALVVAGLARGQAARAFSNDAHVAPAAALAAGLGPALVIALYDYAGYGQTCTLGDEIADPKRTLPRSILLAVLAVAVLYVATQLGVLAIVPWRELVPATPGGDAPALANYVASSVVERVWGTWPARVVTVAVLVTAFASTYGNLLGASRVPYAAARDGVFFPAFARLHERARFPAVSLVVLGLIALPACFLSLGDVINALTAGLVIVQSIAQIVALGVLRARGVRAPYRMWLYPVPALVAIVGWAAIFCSSGAPAIVFGLGSLALGIVVYLVRAKLASDWPFLERGVRAAALVACVATALVAGAGPARAATWGHAAIATEAGESTFLVDGKPFFLYGAAFFYERLPRTAWHSSMLRLRGIGINTLDLYVPWNWHEPADGAFDFDGHTNPRRDFDRVLSLARTLGFEIVLRPGPVIRNEWRNGGYPAWLLSRPEYGMPAHDLLEGRYPPTATLQNARSDDAAAAWLRNATHRYYARRWIERVLRECAPDADRIVAIALDDDQGAYIDNQTWPAPHLAAYLGWLRDVVHGVTGPREPVFINTYQMKVTASSPVWAMGNWYQSDAYALGEHDRAQLAFSMGLLHTRPGQPLMASEFQAGWLLQPDDIRPRPADPSNTSLAFATMLGSGVRGLVNFPAQDTLYPSGWEAPFANAFYAWDAALGLDGRESARAAPTEALGALVATLGPELARSRVRYDAAIAYLGESFGTGRATNGFFANLETLTIAAQSACRDAGLSCALVDPATSAGASLERYPLVIAPVPPGATAADETALVRARFGAYVAARGRLTPLLSADALARAFAALHRRPAVRNVADASFAVDPGGHLDGFLTVANYGPTARFFTHASVTLADGTQRMLPPFAVPAHAALVAPVGVRLASVARGFAPDDRLVFTDCMPLRSAFRNGSIEEEFARVDASHDDVRSETPRCTIRVRLNGTTRDVAVDATAMRALAISRSGTVVRRPADARSPREAAGRGDEVPVRDDVALATEMRFRPVAAGDAVAYAADPYADGTGTAVLDNGVVRVLVSAEAGARSFAFEDDRTHRSVFTTVGGLRDDVAIEPPLSTVDRIAAYTHQFPAGTFNRPYRTSFAAFGDGARATFTYDAPDVVPNGATFERTLTLAPNARAFSMDESATFAAGTGPEPPQRAVSVTSLAVGDGSDMSTRRLLAPDDSAFAPGSAREVAGHALGFYDTKTHELATIAWRDGDVESATVLERRFSIVTRLTLARGRPAHLRYGYESAVDEPAARDLLAASDAAAQAP